MLQKVEITDPGDSLFLKEEQVDKLEFEEMNEKLENLGKTPAKAQQCFSASPKHLCKRVRSFLRRHSGNNPRPH